MSTSYAIDLHMRVDNAAFDSEQLPGEVARILRDLATKVDRHSRADLNKSGLDIRDHNGNLIGSLNFGDIMSDESEETRPG